ncbi:tetratricopeptide repeat protein [Bernardetia sp.]|uniref:tetratricopeptide repeat protein n=1 Tax=Bernardetia sp. TaxID=1937974 RepID=UPI0025BE5DD8|nr:tetratricopeptide repeat protein [Bernardetia sp.]
MKNDIPFTPSYTIKKIVTLLLILIFSISFSDLYAQRKGKKDKGKDKENSSEIIQKEPINGDVSNSLLAEQAFFEGMREFIKEEYKRAIPYFEEALKYEPNNPTAYYQISLCYYKTNNLQEALMYAMEAEKMEDKNFYFLSHLATIQMDMRMLDAAERTYKQILSKIGGDEITYLNLAALYIEMSEYKKAIQTYDRMEKELGLNQNVIRQKQILYLQMEDEEAAVKEGEKLILEFPNVVEFRLAQAELLLSQKKYADAERLLTEIKLGEDDFPAKAHLLLAQIYHQQEKLEQEAQSLKKAFESSEMEIEPKLSLLMGLYQSANPNTEKGKNTVLMSIDLAKTLTKVHSQTSSSFGILGDLLLQQKEYKQAFEAYKEALKIEPNNYSLWERTTQLALESKNYEYAISTSEDALEYFPNQPNLWFLNGIAYMSSSKNEEAITSLEQGKRMVFNNPELLSQFESQLGDIHYKNKSYQKADAAYERALKQNPNNAHALNNYSYYLSLREEKMDVATQLGERLVKLYPNNPTYLDTYGWILYVNKDYKEAEKYLALAAQTTKSATIFEHYGDVLFKLGKKEDAILQWKKAYALDATNDELKEKITKEEER